MGNFKIFIIRAYTLKEHKQPPFIVRVGEMQLMSIEMQVPSPDFPEANYTSLVNFSPPLTVGNFFLKSTNSELG